MQKTPKRRFPAQIKFNIIIVRVCVYNAVVNIIKNRRKELVWMTWRGGIDPGTAREYNTSIY